MRNVYMLAFSITSERNPKIAESYIDGGSEIEKNDKDRRKKHNQNDVKMRKLILPHHETLELFLKNVAQYLV